MNFFKRQQPQIPQRQVQPQAKGDGCKMKIQRDSNGRIIGYSDNGKCSPKQLEAFRDGIGENSESEED